MKDQNNKGFIGKIKALLNNKKSLYGIIAILAFMVVALGASVNGNIQEANNIVSSASAEIQAISVSADSLENQIAELESQSAEAESLASEQSSLVDTLRQENATLNSQIQEGKRQFESLSQAYEPTTAPETSTQETDDTSDNSSGGGSASGRFYGGDSSDDTNETEEPETMEDGDSEPEYHYARTVYWTPNGEVYHYSENCRTLSRSKTIYSGTISESGKDRACKVCS